MMKKLGFLKSFYLGKSRFAEFALTNSCSSKCTFCSIWKQQPKVFVDREKAWGFVKKYLSNNQYIIIHKVKEVKKNELLQNIF